MERFKTSLETLTLPFRFIVPGLLGLLFYCYSGDQVKLHADISDIKQSIKDDTSDLKSSQDKIWTAVSTNAKINDSKFSYVYQQCCVQAKVAPPS